MTSIPGFTTISEQSGITEYRLDTNGLTVLVGEDHTAPVATLMVTYKVGSRFEQPGYTGSTHILEHLLFKGSKNFDKEKNVFDELLVTGAEMNATTWTDRTNYYECLPVRFLEKATEIEADRMRNALLRAEDLASEMTVVRNEYERGENDPSEALDKAVWETAFTVHPYRYTTIGLREDIENSNVERLREFYDMFYWPNNAVVMVLGDIDVSTTLEWVKKYFGAHTASPHSIPVATTVEPLQNEMRTVTVKRAGGGVIVQLAYKNAASLHPDAIAIDACMSVLCSGNTSRLHRALVDTGTATSVYSYNPAFYDPGLASVIVEVRHGTDPKEIERIIRKSCADIATGGITEAELQRVKHALELDLAVSRDGTLRLAKGLNEAIAAGDWHLAFNVEKLVQNLTPADIQRVAREYLRDDRSTLGVFEPTNNPQ